jgi:aminopeptidase N
METAWTEDYAGGRHCLVEGSLSRPLSLALVAGDLGMISDTYVTKSGRSVDCRVYCDRGNEDRCRHALASLKKAMKWDEERFGLEYDLDIYMIVAVESFNMGAMENKGLNIFNSKYVLASEDTAMTMITGT